MSDNVVKENTTDFLLRIGIYHNNFAGRKLSKEYPTFEALKNAKPSVDYLVGLGFTNFEANTIRKKLGLPPSTATAATASNTTPRNTANDSNSSTAPVASTTSTPRVESASAPSTDDKASKPSTSAVAQPSTEKAAEPTSAAPPGQPQPSGTKASGQATPSTQTTKPPTQPSIAQTKPTTQPTATTQTTIKPTAQPTVTTTTPTQQPSTEKSSTTQTTTKSTTTPHTTTKPSTQTTPPTTNPITQPTSTEKPSTTTQTTTKPTTTPQTTTKPPQPTPSTTPISPTPQPTAKSPSKTTTPTTPISKPSTTKPNTPSKRGVEIPIDHNPSSPTPPPEKDDTILQIKVMKEPEYKVLDQPDRWIIAVSLPGTKKDQIVLKIVDNCLIVSAPLCDSETSRRLCIYEKKFEIPKYLNIKELDTEARFENSVLVIEVMKPQGMTKNVNKEQTQQTLATRIPLSTSDVPTVPTGTVPSKPVKQQGPKKDASTPTPISTAPSQSRPHRATEKPNLKRTLDGVYSSDPLMSFFEPPLTSAAIPRSHLNRRLDPFNSSNFTNDIFRTFFNDSPFHDDDLFNFVPSSRRSRDLIGLDSLFNDISFPVSRSPLFGRYPLSPFF